VNTTTNHRIDRERGYVRERASTRERRACAREKRASAREKRASAREKRASAREREHPRERESEYDNKPQDTVYRERGYVRGGASTRARERASAREKRASARERERASAREKRASAREREHPREREREHKPTQQLASQTTYLQGCGGDKGRERSREKEDVVHHRHRICFSFKANKKNENFVLAAL
jgi:hypothetical protein